MTAKVTTRIALAVTAAMSAVVAGALPSIGQTLPLDFKGQMIVGVSDADMPASAYFDGKLGPPVGQDVLFVIDLASAIGAAPTGQVPVSNSVAGPPAVLAITPDGRYAIVVETLGPATDKRSFADLARGRGVFVVDLIDRARPRVVQALQAPARADAVSISPDGSLVAVALYPQDAGAQTPLLLYRFRNGRLSEPVMPILPSWTAGDRLIDASFHPKMPVIALLNATKETLSFVKVSDGGGPVQVSAWGNAVGIDKAPYIARFTPDGRHVLTAGTYSGRDVLDGGFGAPLGTMLSIRVNGSQDADGSPRHVLVSRAQTGGAPEGFAISPDGRRVVTTNLERTALPFDDPRLTQFASLTLLHLDPEQGGLLRIGDFPFDGILPESVVFDNSGQYLAVATFDHFDGRRPAGSVDFWRITSDPLIPSREMLVKTDKSVKVVRGAHTLSIVR